MKQLFQEKQRFTVSLSAKTIAASKATTRVAIAAAINFATKKAAIIPATIPVKTTTAAAVASKISAIKNKKQLQQQSGSQ